MKTSSVDFDTLFLWINTYKIDIHKKDIDIENIDIFIKNELKKIDNYYNHINLMIVLDIPIFLNSNIKWLFYINQKLEYNILLSDCYLREITLSNNLNLVEFDEKKHIIDIVSFAENLSKVSRYYRDKQISSKAKDIYIERIRRNLIYRSNKTFVCLDNNKVVWVIFLVIENNKTLIIDLIWVLPSYQWKWIWKKLIIQTFNYALQNWFENIKVITQWENIGAVNLYEKTWFKIKWKSFIYHYHR